MPLAYDEVAKHDSRASCWVIVHGKAFDLTEFLPEHPGGSKILLKYAGHDATKAFDPIHPPGTLEENLPPEKCLGEVDPATLQGGVALIESEKPGAKKAASQASASRQGDTGNSSGGGGGGDDGDGDASEEDAPPPPLSTVLNLFDFEAIGSRRLDPAAWAYYSSGADDEVTLRENAAVFGRVWFRPRILQDVSRVDFSTSILGHRTSLPVYVTATALGRLGHPDGEKNLTWACGEENLIQMIPTLASCSMDELVEARTHQGQVQFFQLYVNANRQVTERLVRKAESKGIKALFITVDAPQLGRREKDMRLKFADAGSQVQNDEDEEVDRSQGAARAISSFIDPSLNWDDLHWFRSITRLPLILKGVQRWEDAVLAAQAGCAGIVISNHGGRQLDFSRSSLEVLAEVVPALKERNLFPSPSFQIFVDGGFRRATDVLKAVALGATAVGIGRPFLYAYSVYGHQGVAHGMRLLKAEMEMNMRLLGARTLGEVTPDLVDTRSLYAHINPSPGTNAARIWEAPSLAVSNRPKL